MQTNETKKKEQIFIYFFAMNLSHKQFFSDFIAHSPPKLVFIQTKYCKIIEHRTTYDKHHKNEEIIRIRTVCEEGARYVRIGIQKSI